MAARKRKKVRKKAKTDVTANSAGTKSLVNKGITGVMLLFAAILIILEFVDIVGYTYQWWQEVGSVF
ncbi:hypothetical protein GCM10028806_42250 [Spirosoma terrae]|uniref:Uncharacterized protein n=1 Tax=Spirosoma terrae TaxID=1968276 RepID=A0A6L9LBA9_9BACT|nr:hypothetical protein [Spirosoma terrae]NDU94109.1 hypothetical protein [Spirosoma terrae]